MANGADLALRDQRELQNDIWWDLYNNNLAHDHWKNGSAYVLYNLTTWFRFVSAVLVIVVWSFWCCGEKNGGGAGNQSNDETMVFGGIKNPEVQTKDESKFVVDPNANISDNYGAVEKQEP